MDTKRALLTTGQAVKILGCSRQHVVDLCNSGRLRSSTVGTHRRIAREDVWEFRGQVAGLRREEERSLWLHRVLLGHLLRDPDRVLEHGRSNIRRWRSQHREDGMSQHWLRRWERLLDQGVDAVADVLSSRDSEAVELRANSPFAGVLGEGERLAVHLAFRRHWSTEHDAA
jgi:excisionase family DNA binding protein